MKDRLICWGKERLTILSCGCVDASWGGCGFGGENSLSVVEDVSKVSLPVLGDWRAESICFRAEGSLTSLCRISRKKRCVS